MVTSMDAATRFTLLDALFAEARDLPDDALRGFLSDVQDPSLRAELNELILQDRAGTPTIRALLDIAVRGCQPIYNVAAGANLGNDQLAHLVQAHSGRHLAYTLDQAHAPAAVAAIQRLQAEFGWCPTGVEERLAPWLRRLPV